MPPRISDTTLRWLTQSLLPWSAYSAMWIRRLASNLVQMRLQEAQRCSDRFRGIENQVGLLDWLPTGNGPLHVRPVQFVPVRNGAPAPLDALVLTRFGGHFILAEARGRSATNGSAFEVPR
jgi:hypothetical protein